MAFWVFGYGSLLWNPGFHPAEARRAVLKDFHRSFCMLSIHHRGSEAEPGLVLALDTQEGGQCTGVAFRIAEEDENSVLAALRERELISSAYYEDTLPLKLDDGRDVHALCYIINRDHRQYCQYDLETQAQIIARSVGGKGPNPEYLFNTADHLTEMGIRDDDMGWLVTRVKEIMKAH
ncbi:cation transport protein ChaC [Cognatiyoonia koreensis]|uniref:glutathione-specific gamma-glutamylcyclotransferase n=1 Tax=Cognatiyoonia koreensis TaxID=364200 RepID=A0A1I0MXA2_9RHOB|nr:gamma-glutamylcyclotransferase [Cognatiyoonia koreensis]SEV92698.1 cation transport protein ChaC [Cognatiyoonia koreensis]